MEIAAIPMLINSDFMEIPLDKRLDLADYKMYGEKSHVFQNKDRLHSLYEYVGLSMNDLTINGETLEYFIKKNKAGAAFASVYGIKNVQTLATLTAMQAVANSSTAMQAVAASSTAMTAVVNSSTAMTAVLNSSTAMTAVANSSTAMTLIASNEKIMEQIISNDRLLSIICKASYDKIKAFIKVVNNNNEYIKTIFDTVKSSSKFKHWKSHVQYGQYSRVNGVCNKANTIILCRLGYYSTGSKTRVLINGEKIKETDTGGQWPNTIERENVNAVCIPTAVFENAQNNSVVNNERIYRRIY